MDTIDIDFWHINYRQAYKHFQGLMSNADADTTAASYAGYCDTAIAPVFSPGGWLVNAAVTA